MEDLILPGVMVDEVTAFSDEAAPPLAARLWFQLADNRELIALAVMVIALFAAAAAIGIAFRGGQPWAYHDAFERVVARVRAT